MNDKTLILLFTCFIPLFTALVSAIIEGISIQDSVTMREKRVKWLLMCYFITFIFIGSGVATGVAVPQVATQIWPFTVFALYMAPVLYYRFICVLTDIGNKDQSLFSIHYLFPLLAGIGCCTLYYIVPMSVRLQLVIDRTAPHYPISNIIFRTIPVVQFVLTAIYMLLAYQRLADCYERRKRYTKWRKWFRLSVFLCILSCIWSGVFLLTMWQSTATLGLVVAIIAAWMQAIYLCCNTFNSGSLLFLPLNIVFIRPPKKQTDTSVASSPATNTPRVPRKLKRTHFEKEVVAKKLYLNPKLRITDLTEILNINRTYLSNFVNHTYGCGFSEYINRLRHHELERLLSMPRHKGKTAKQLFQKAGFPSYRNYLRTKKTEDDENISNNSLT